jgi:hypothetical protein
MNCAFQDYLIMLCEEATVVIIDDSARMSARRRQRLDSRWNMALTKQSSFTLPKVPCRRRLSNETDEDVVRMNSSISSMDSEGISTTDKTPKLPSRRKALTKQSPFILPTVLSHRGLGDDYDGDKHWSPLKPVDEQSRSYYLAQEEEELSRVSVTNEGESTGYSMNASSLTGLMLSGTCRSIH